MILLSLIEWRFDFHFFVKFSACRREDFAKVTEITSTLSSHLEKHCTSPWISLVKILVKLVEQIDNLKLYFLNTLPILPSQDSMERERVRERQRETERDRETQRETERDRGIASTARYKQIRELSY